MEKQQTESNIVKYKKKRQFNFVFVVFLFILIYLIVQLYFMMNRRSIGVFTVGVAAENTRIHDYRGVITRDEQIITTSDAGYVNYYVREGRKVNVGATVYTTDAGGEFSRMLAETYTDGSCLSNAMLSEIKDRLTDAAAVSVGGDFQRAYRDKKELAAVVNDSFLLTAAQELQGEQEDFPDGVTAEQSGYVLFFSDSLDGLIPEQVTAETFEESSLQTTVYVSGGQREAGAFAYKLIPDDAFSITFQITQEDAKQYQDRKYLSIELLSLGVTVNGSFSIFTSSDGQTLATVTLKKYGSEYLKDRYVDFRIAETPVNGYKIPISSVVSKDFLVVPPEYVTKGGDNDNTYGVCREVYGQEADSEFIAVSIYARTDAYYYIASSQLSIGDYLIEPDSTNRFLLSITAPLQGVYNVNKGYCIFRQVEIINTTTDNNYYMIKTGTGFGLSPYDRIVQNADLVEENEIIY